MPIGIFKNNKNLLRSSLWLLVLRFFGLFQSLLTVKIYFGFFNHSLFAFLIVLFSYQIVFSFFDLGLSNAIINRGVNYIVRKKPRSLSSLFLGSLTFLFFWTVVLNVLLVLLIKFSFLKDYIFPGISDRNFVVRMFLLCAALSTIRCALSIVNNFRLVFNQTYFNGIFDSAALLVSIIGQLLAVRFQLNFVWHVLIIFGVPALGHLSNLLLLFKQYPYLTSTSNINVLSFFRKEVKPVLGDGAKFFTLQLVSTFAYNSVPVILSFFAKTSEIAVYGILIRIFNPVSSLITVFLQPQWSYLSQSYLNKDFSLIKKSFKFSLVFVIIVCLAYFLMLFLLKDVIKHYLLKDQLIFSLNILLLFCLWIVLSNVGGVYSTILNALNIISFQVLFAIVLVFLFAIEIILFVPQYGLSAVLFFISLNVLITGIIPSFIKTNRLLNA